MLKTGGYLHARCFAMLGRLYVRDYMLLCCCCCLRVMIRADEGMRLEAACV